VNFGYWARAFPIVNYGLQRGQGRRVEGKRKEKGPMINKYQHFLVRQQKRSGYVAKCRSLQPIKGQDLYFFLTYLTDSG
jgi:hypothetical protein